MPETYEQIQARFRAELDPSVYAATPCQLDPWLSVPALRPPARRAIWKPREGRRAGGALSGHAGETRWAR